MEMDINQDTLMNPSGQPVTNEEDVPGAGIGEMVKGRDLNALIEEQKELDKTTIDEICKGRKDCLPVFLTRIGENCNRLKCYDFSIMRRWACRFDQQITLSISDLQGNTVFNSAPGNEKESLKGGTVRLISIPQGLNAGQSYNVDIKGPNFPTQRLEGRF